MIVESLSVQTVIFVGQRIARLNTPTRFFNSVKCGRLTDYKPRKNQRSGSAARPYLSASRSKSDQYGPILADPSDNEVLTIRAEPVRRKVVHGRGSRLADRPRPSHPISLSFPPSLFSGRVFCLGSSRAFRLSPGTGHRNDRLT